MNLKVGEKVWTSFFYIVFTFNPQLTAADVHFLTMVEAVEMYFPNSLAKYPKLKAVFDRVATRSLPSGGRFAPLRGNH